MSAPTTDLEIIERGGVFFPLPPGDKAAPPDGVTGKGASMRLTAAERAALLTGAPPNANRGLVLGRDRVERPDGTWGGLVVVDEDNKPSRVTIDGKRCAAQRGSETIAALAVRLGPLPRTLTSRTPGHGCHRLFWIDDRIADVPPKLLRRDPALGGDCGVEILTEGRYIVTAPSVLAPDVAARKGYVSGAYAWEDASAPIARLPEAWVEYLAGLAPTRRPGVARARAGGEPPGAERVDPVPIRNPESDYGRWRIEQAIRYLLSAPLSIRGNGGRDTMFRVAVVLVRRMRLPLDIAGDLIELVYCPRLVAAGTTAWARATPGPHGMCIDERLVRARDTAHVPAGDVVSEEEWHRVPALFGGVA